MSGGKKREIIADAEQLPMREVLHPAVAEVLKHNPTPEALAQILETQREWEKDQARRAFHAAKVDLKKALPAWIDRDQLVDFGQGTKRVRYTHVSLAHAMDVLLPALNDYGFTLSWTTESLPTGKVKVTAKLTHRDGHFESSSLESSPDTSGSKSNSQGVASTVTLLQRYTALALVGIATADMKDPGPPPPPAGDEVDTDRNLRAMGVLVTKGKTKKQAEKKVGRAVQEWTGDDLEKLREWITPKTEKKVREITKAKAATSVVSEEPVDLKLLDRWRKSTKLTVAQMVQLIRNTIGKHVHAPKELKPEEFAKLRAWFDRLAAKDPAVILDMDTLTFGELPPSAGPGGKKGEEDLFGERLGKEHEH